jgi:hypothetical protein
MEHTGSIFLNWNQHKTYSSLRQVKQTLCCCAKIEAFWVSVLYTRGAEELVPKNGEVAIAADSLS